MTSLLRCRKCDAEILSDTAECPKCHIPRPFVCADCGKEIGNLQAIGSAYPFTKEGQPLCNVQPMHGSRSAL